MKKQDIHYLIVGLGSMGKRRIRNLQHLGESQITGFDPRADRRDEAQKAYGIPVIDDFNLALSWDVNALVISTPPDLHRAYMDVAVNRGLHFFCEAGIPEAGLDNLAARAEKKGIVAAPSCTLRFHPSIKKMKVLIDAGDIGPVHALSYHSGQYLPDWHPWESIRDFYVGKRETGGCREIVPFELVWLTWLLGDVREVMCFKGQVGDLGVDIDDVYQILMRFASGTLGHLLVDVLARRPTRVCRFVGAEGVLEWDYMAGKVYLHRAGSDAAEIFAEPSGITRQGYHAKEDMYIEEMAAFVGAVKGGAPFPHDLRADQKILNLLLAAEESSERGVRVKPGVDA
jgi:predicted dehydrogenase